MLLQSSLDSAVVQSSTEVSSLRSELVRVSESRMMLIEEYMQQQQHITSQLLESESDKNLLTNKLELQKKKFLTEIEIRDKAVAQLEAAVEAIAIDRERLDTAESLAKQSLREKEQSQIERNSLLSSLEEVKTKALEDSQSLETLVR